MKQLTMIVMMAFIVTIANAQTQAPAAEKSTHYKATEALMEAMMIPETIDKNVTQMVDLQIGSNPMLAGKKDAFTAFMLKHMSWAAVKEDYIKIYMEEFTEADIKDMTEFYRTPTGKKFAAKQLAITMKSARLGQAKVEANMAELQQIMQ